MSLTYHSLLTALQKMTPEQLQQDVTVYDANNDETFAVEDVAVAGQEDVQDIRPDGVLDDGHPYLLFNV